MFAEDYFDNDYVDDEIPDFPEVEQWETHYPAKRPVGRPRLHHPKPAPLRQWKRSDISAEEIIKLQKAGMSNEAIADRFGCSRYTIQGRLRQHREQKPPERICPECGRGKLPERPYCRSCIRSRK